jgi:hypothetical protein
MLQIIELLPLHNSMKTHLLCRRSSLTIALDLFGLGPAAGLKQPPSGELESGGDAAFRLYVNAISWADASIKSCR